MYVSLSCIGCICFSCYSPSFEVGRRWKCTVCRRQTKGSGVSWYCHQRSPTKVLLNIVHPSYPLALKLQLDSFRKGISVINCFVVVWNISLVMFWRFVLRDFLCGGVSKPMSVMMAVSTDLIDFYVVSTTKQHL